MSDQQDPLIWTVDDVVDVFFHGPNPILGPATRNADAIEQHLRNEQIDGNCLLTYITKDILRGEFGLPHGLINRVVQAVKLLRANSQRFQAEYAATFASSPSLQLMGTPQLTAEPW